MSSNRKTLIFENNHSITNYLYRQWFALANMSVAQRGRFCVALSGGKTPVEFYCRLSNLHDHNLWQNTVIFSTDERFVPHDDPDSNYRMIKESLLDYVNIPQENVHPVPTAAPDAKTSAELYEEDILNYFSLKVNDYPEFDFVLLGLGSDGHTASLFTPEHVSPSVNNLAIATHGTSAKHERISLTMPVINNAAHVFFLVTGAGKAAIVKDIVEKKHSHPASFVIPEKGDLTILLDREAASQLNFREAFSIMDDAIVLH